MDNFDTFYKGVLEKLGYKTELFQHPRKKHGKVLYIQLYRNHV